MDLTLKKMPEGLFYFERGCGGKSSLLILRESTQVRTKLQSHRRKCLHLGGGGKNLNPALNCTHHAPLNIQTGPAFASALLNQLFPPKDVQPQRCTAPFKTHKPLYRFFSAKYYLTSSASFESQSHVLEPCSDCCVAPCLASTTGMVGETVEKYE